MVTGAARAAREGGGNSSVSFVQSSDDESLCVAPRAAAAPSARWVITVSVNVILDGTK